MFPFNLEGKVWIMEEYKNRYLMCQIITNQYQEVHFFASLCYPTFFPVKMLFYNLLIKRNFTVDLTSLPEI